MVDKLKNNTNPWSLLQSRSEHALKSLLWDPRRLGVSAECVKHKTCHKANMKLDGGWAQEYETQNSWTDDEPVLLRLRHQEFGTSHQVYTHRLPALPVRYLWATWCIASIDSAAEYSFPRLCTAPRSEWRPVAITKWTREVTERMTTWAPHCNFVLVGTHRPSNSPRAVGDHSESNRQDLTAMSKHKSVCDKQQKIARVQETAINCHASRSCSRVWQWKSTAGILQARCSGSQRTTGQSLACPRWERGTKIKLVIAVLWWSDMRKTR